MSTTVTLTHPAVRAAKARWNESKRYCARHSKRKVTFEQYFAYFRKGILNVRIAELVGLSSERIRKIYDQYFRQLFGGKSGRERMKAIALENRIANLKYLERRLFNDNATVKKIVRQARGAGCTVEAVSGYSMYKVMHKYLLIDGHRCSVHRATYKMLIPGMKSYYARVAVRCSSITEEKAIIIHSAIPGEVERTFVIPTVALRKAMPVIMKRERTWIYLPTKKIPAYRNHLPQMDFWRYEGAWHLLR